MKKEQYFCYWKIGYIIVNCLKSIIKVAMFRKIAKSAINKNEKLGKNCFFWKLIKRVYLFFYHLYLKIFFIKIYLLSNVY